MKTNNGLERLNVHLAQIIDRVKAKEFSKPVLSNPRLLSISVSCLITTFPVIHLDFYSRNSTKALTLMSL